MARIFISWQGVAAPIHFISISYKKQANFIAKATPFQMRKRPVTFYCNQPLLFVFLVGATGFEPATPCSQSRCATRLRHAPRVGRYSEKYLPWQARRKRPGLFCLTAGSVVFGFQRLHEFFYGHNTVDPADVGAAECKAPFKISLHGID